MSASLGMSSTKQKSKSESDPWSPTIPYLEDYLGQVGDLSTQPMTGDQSAAASEVKNIYAQGNPFAGQIGQLANDTFAGPGSQSGMMGQGYADLQKRLTPYADGKFLDFKENPYINDMLTTVGDSVQQRINAQFAGAGRDLSGMNQKTVGAGVAGAMSPILAQLYSQEQDRALGAANTLYGASNTTAQGMQGLDTAALQARAGALPISQAANDANLWGPQGIYNLEQLTANAPFERMGMLGNLLLPVAQLGQQQSSSGKSSTVGANVGAKLLSDERLKENIREIGMMADGTPMVRFNYKGDPTVRIGVRAQDVEELSPEAVSEYSAPQAGTDDGNVKYVDMDLATQRSADMMADGAGPGMGGALSSMMPGMLPPELQMQAPAPQGLPPGMAQGPGPQGPGAPGLPAGPMPGAMAQGALPPPIPRPMLEDEMFMRSAA